MNTNTISSICKKYSFITDKCTKHSYCDIYDKLFSEYKSLEINLLEIGVAGGGSIFMWWEYFEKAQIYSFDINDMPTYLSENLKDNRYKHHKGDAYSKSAVGKLPNLDILIDDGPHTEESFKKLIELYSSKINYNGLLIIEDIDIYNHNIPKIIAHFPSDFSVSFIDLTARNNIGDDSLIIARKIK